MSLRMPRNVIGLIRSMLHLSLVIGSRNRRGVSSLFFCQWKTTLSLWLGNEVVWKIYFAYQCLRGVCLRNTIHLHFAVRCWQLHIIFWYSCVNRISWYHLHNLVSGAIFKKRVLIFRLPLIVKISAGNEVAICIYSWMSHLFTFFKSLTKSKVKVLV